MKFEFDPNKSEINRAKHGIDFVDGQAIWADPNRIEGAPAASQGEARWYAIGLIDGTLWTATYTVRDGATRIISIRRARDEEREVYEI